MSSVSSGLSMQQMQVAIARKQMDAVEQQGKQALALIEAAAPADQRAGNVPAHVGTQLDVTA